MLCQEADRTARYVLGYILPEPRPPELTIQKVKSLYKAKMTGGGIIMA